MDERLRRHFDTRKVEDCSFPGFKPWKNTGLAYRPGNVLIFRKVPRQFRYRNNFTLLAHVNFTRTSSAGCLSAEIASLIAAIV